MSPTEQARGDSGKERKLHRWQNGEKTLGETRLSWGASSPPARQISSLFQLQQSQSVSGPLVPGVFPRWMSRWRGPHWRSVSGAHLGGVVIVSSQVFGHLYRLRVACFILHGFGRFLGFSDWFATGISEHLKEGSFTLMKNALFCMRWNMEMTWFVLLHIISRVEPHIPAPSLPGISSAWQVCQRKDKLAVEICSGQTHRDILLLTGYSLISPRYGTWAWLWNKCLWSILFIGLRNVVTFIHRCTWTAPFWRYAAADVFKSRLCMKKK